MVWLEVNETLTLELVTTHLHNISDKINHAQADHGFKRRKKVLLHGSSDSSAVFCFSVLDWMCKEKQHWGGRSLSLCLGYRVYPLAKDALCSENSNKPNHQWVSASATAWPRAFSVRHSEVKTVQLSWLLWTWWQWRVSVWQKFLQHFLRNIYKCVK